MTTFRRRFAHFLLGASLPIATALSLPCCGAAPASPALEPSKQQTVASSPLKTEAKREVLRSELDLATKFADLRDRIVTSWLDYDPAFARSLGFHEYDGRVADYSSEAISTRLMAVREQKNELEAIDGGALSPDDALDRAILLKELGLQLFDGEELALYRTSPRFYEALFGVNAYIDRDYAPLEERANKLLEHEKGALAQIPNIRKNLKSPLSKPVIETAIKIYSGYADYLRGDVKKLLGGVGGAAFQESFRETNEKLAQAAQDLAQHLKTKELPRGDNSHVLGPERYKKLLQAQEGLTLDLAEFKKKGEANLAVNRKAYEELLGKVKITRPKAEDLLVAATKVMDQSRAFVLAKGLVSIPSEDLAVVKETPPYMRWNSAFLDGPGPFERNAKEAFYYITMPDPSWPKKEQEGYIMDHGILLSTSVHEVYPGHFLQGLWAKRAPTKVQKLASSYSFVEGWAHYAEQMMVEEGFGADNPQSRMGQLSDALLRNCRYVASIGIHTEGMTLEQAARRFERDCHQDKATAREQAIRGTFDPGYFAYTLGKIQILELRDEAKRALGAKFSLKRFHDALLAHGSPSIPLIRERILRELDIK